MDLDVEFSRTVESESGTEEPAAEEPAAAIAPDAPASGDDGRGLADVDTLAYESAEPADASEGLDGGEACDEEETPTE